MRRLIGIILMALLWQPMLRTVTAQEQEEDRNTVFKVAIGEFSYTPKQQKENVGSVLGAVGEALLLGKTTKRHDNYNEAVRASIVKGLSGVRRFNAIDGAFQEGEVKEGMKALYVDGTILNVSDRDAHRLKKENLHYHLLQGNYWCDGKRERCN